MSNITRTFFTTIISAKVFDNVRDEITTCTATIPGKIAMNDCKKAIEKHIAIDKDFTLLKILSVNYGEKLYSMSEENFMRFGKPYDARNKETRGTVSKEIVGTVANCVVVDNDSYNVETVDYMLPRKMDSDTAKRYLNKTISGRTVVKVNLVEVKQLYAMPVNVFMENAEILPPRTVKDTDK